MLPLRVACALAVLTLGRSAFGEQRVPLRYTTDGDPSCPPAEHVHNEIALRVGRVVTAETVHVEIRRDGGDHVAVMRIERGGDFVQERRIASASTSCSCLAVAQSAAVAAAYALTPFAVCPPPKDCPGCPPCQEPTVAPRCPAASDDGPVFEVGGAVLGSVGLGPSPTIGGTAFARLRWRYTSLAMEVTTLVPWEGVAEDGAPISIGLISGGFVPCLHVGPFSGCGLIHAGFITHDNERAVATDATFLLALGLRAGLAIPFGALSLGVHGDLATVATPPVTYLNGRQVWAASVTGTLGLGVAWRL